MIANTLVQVKNGEISEARLNDAVKRILRVKLRAGLFNGKPSSRIPSELAASIGQPSHRAVARQAVRESLVLFKNKDRLLPISASSRILLAGDGANNIPKQSGGWSITWQGRGTTNSHFPGATSILAGIQTQVAAAGGKVEYSVSGEFQIRPDVAVVVVGEAPYAEGQGDVNTLEFEPGNKRSLALIKKIRAQGIPVVTVLLSGRPLWVNPEINASDAFVAAWLPGSEGAGIADVLLRSKTGEIQHDFKGRLSFSWPGLPLQDEVNLGDATYEPLFPFGYGLTYQSVPTQMAALAENVAGVVSAEPQDIPLYVARPLEPWNIFIQYKNQNLLLSGAIAQSLDRQVVLQTTDKDVQEDALRFTWRSVESAKMAAVGGFPLDLSRFAKTGMLVFDVRMNAGHTKDIVLQFGCGEGCQYRASLKSLQVQDQAAEWQRVQLPLRCLKLTEDQMAAVTEPFTLWVTNQGEVDVANIQYRVESEGGPAHCPKSQLPGHFNDAYKLM